MNVGSAITAGLAGGLAMTALGALIRLAGIPMNGEMMMGTMVSAPGPMAWLIGLLIHLMLSVLIAVVYAWGFERVTQRAGVGVGLGFSLIHIVIAGMVMGTFPAMHPMIPEQMPAPGAFLSAMGGTFVAIFVLEHLLYGGIVGGMYRVRGMPRTVQPAAI